MLCYVKVNIDQQKKAINNFCKQFLLSIQFRPFPSDKKKLYKKVVLNH